MNIVPLVLVKNDCYWLPFALQSVAGHFERMIIYNVGSTDGTKEIIDWYVDKEKDTDFIVRHLPDCPPEVQLTFRNSMIAEARSPLYLILDGDEIYNKNDLFRINEIGNILLNHNEQNNKIKYALFRRVEVSSDLLQRYNNERTHHRLYHRDAIWMGTHPGEVPLYEQNSKSELDFTSDIRMLHLHNTLRSPKEEETQSRTKRKSQRSYHPEGGLVDFNVFEEFPILQQRVANFPASPCLEALWA